MRCEKAIVSPWINALSGGVIFRRLGDAVVAFVGPTHGGAWNWLAGEGSGGTAPTVVDAKKRADNALTVIGFRLVNVPGGCTIESDEPKKLQRVYREG